MVAVDFDEKFIRTISKIKDALIRKRVENLILKIKNNPEIGKPMKNIRKGTRELYLPPFGLSYAYSKTNNKVIILEFYHKDKQ